MTASVTPRAALLVAALSSVTVNAQPAPPVVVWEQAAEAHTVAFSPDGQYVASGGYVPDTTGSRGRVDLFAASDGASLGHAETHAGGGVVGFVNEVAFSPDGTRLASAHGTADCTSVCADLRPGLFTWSVPTLGALVGTEDIRRATSTSFSPDGGTLAVAMGPVGGPVNHSTVLFYDPATFAITDSLEGYTSFSNVLRFGPTSARLATVGSDADHVDRVRLWDTPPDSLMWAREHGDFIEGGAPTSLAFSPDGALVGSAGYGVDLHAKVWDAATGDLVYNLDANVDTLASNGLAVVAFSPNGAYLLAGIHENMELAPFRRTVLRFWDVSTGEVAAEYEETNDEDRITGLAFSPVQDHRFAYVVGGVVKVAETALNLASTPTAGAPGTDLPGGFVLSPVHPNPIGTAARFTLAVMVPQALRVTVLDVLGREVALLFDGTLTAGLAHPFELDGTLLRSGAYVVRARGETFVASRHVTVVR